MDDGFKKVGLSPFYLNTNRLEALAGIAIPPAAQTSLNENGLARVEGMRFARGIANTLLRSGRIPNLAKVYAETESPTRVLATLWGTFTFAGAREAFEREQKGALPNPATFTASVDLGDGPMPISGTLINAHFYSQSSISTLSRKRSLLAMGMFDFQPDGVELFPYLFGDLVDEAAMMINVSIRNGLRVYPEEIDAFASMKGTPTVSKGDITKLQALPEATVKAAIADIIGEPFVQADWGGEVSDLQTNHLTIRGSPVSAAFIFKGPGLRGEMHPNNMGKRGDQMIRAFGEPSDLIVIQHCNKIANTVVKLAEIMAIDPRRPRRFCILDGTDTARLLVSHGKL